MLSAPKPVDLLKCGAVGAADGVSDLNKGFLGDGWMKPNEICCHWLEARLVASQVFEDCSLIAAVTEVEPVWDRMMLVSMPYLSQEKTV